MKNLIKYTMIFVTMLGMSSIYAMEKQELLGKKISITEEEWQNLPCYFNRFGPKVVIIKVGTEFLLRQAIPKSNRVSSDVNVQDDKKQASIYSEEFIHFTCDWQKFLESDSGLD